MGAPLTARHGTDDPEVSVVIPVYDEARILGESLEQLVGSLRAEGWSFEVIVAENGSRDGTAEVARAAMPSMPELRVFSYPRPNYGGALREGIYRASGTYVVCEEIDLCDVDFQRRALDLLRRDEADLVIGSKTLIDSLDARPWSRRVATRCYNRVLRTTFGFTGTDTHGLKAFRRAALLPVVAACTVEHDVFASELVIRAQRAHLRVLDVPVHIQEKRAPSVDLLRRVPRVARNLARLMISVHLQEGSPRPPGDPEDP